jgi:ADP-dependent phosphofructokinase/glucokinase
MTYRGVLLPKARVATGLYSNLDSVIKVDEEVVNWIRSSKKTAPKGEELKNLNEAVFSLKSSLTSGDMESLVSKKVHDKIASMFPRREVRTGGNGNNMGKALFELGLRPLVSYPVRPERLMRLSERFNVAHGSSFMSPAESIRKKDPEYDHIIFEAEGWRNILSWDMMTSRGVFDEDFLKLAFNRKFTDIAVISYAHLILPKYKKRTDYLLEFFGRERPRVHLEFGLGSKESMKYAAERFSEAGACDSWGMDENECELYLNAASVEREDLIDAALGAIKEYNLRRICVHSSRYAFSVSKYCAEDEQDALLAGCAAAGLKLFDSLPKMSERPVKKRLDGYNLCIVPTFYTPHPRVLTGLGDILASVQAIKILSSEEG